MKKVYLILMFIVTTTVFAFSQATLTQTLRGNVVDAVTGYPIIGATVLLLESDPAVGTATDENGSFELKNVPIGRQSIEVRYIGYASRSLPNVLITSAKEVVLQIQLEEEVVQVDEVVVQGNKKKEEAQNEMAAVSARTFSIEETERFAGSLGDPARMVANYAGVVTQNDSRNDIIIRGNSPMGVLWRLEGVEIPNPNHFGALGTTGGPVSMINNNLLTNSDFLTGAFPAEYGNAIAGAFDLNMRSGNNEVHEFTGQVGFNGFELGAEGPMFKTSEGLKASYLANFRYSTLDVFHKLGFSTGTGSAIPEYKDLTFLFDVPGTKLGRLKVFGLWGNSYIELGRNLEDTNGNSYNSRGSGINFGSNLGVIGVSHTYFINERIRFKSTLSYQATGATTIYDSVDLREDLTKPYYRSKESEDKISFTTQFRHKLSARDNYSIGFIADWYQINYLDSIYKNEYRKFVILDDIKGKLNLLRTYAQWQHKFSDQVTAYGGVHLQYLNLSKDLSVEPRLSLKWQFTQKQSINMGYGMHSQMQPRTVYYYQTYNPTDNSYSLTNEDLKFTKSNHYILGYNYLITKDFRIKAETYYQYLYQVPISRNNPEYSMLNAGADFAIPRVDSLENKGTGYNYGLELTVEKFLGNGYYFLFTTSLFDSKYKGYDGILRNTTFNGNYVFNLLAGYEHKVFKNCMITFDVKTCWAGGKRYVPIDLVQSRAQHDEVRDWSKAYDKKYNDYFRTDLRIGFKINGRHTTQEWGVDLQNITGYQSLFMEGYDASKNEIYNTYQQGFMPMVLYRIQF